MTQQRDLERQFSEIVRKKYPDVSIPTNFFPLLDLTQGQLSSDLPLLLAAQLKVHPDRVIAELLPAFKQIDRCICSYSNGYLNIELTELRSSDFPTAPLVNSGQKLSLFVAPDCARISELEYLRFIALPITQAYLATAIGYAVELNHGREQHFFDKKQQLLDFFWSQLSALRAGQRQLWDGADIDSAAQDYLIKNKDYNFLWFSPRSLDQNRFNALYKSLAGSNTLVCVPTRSLLSDLKADGLNWVNCARCVDLLFLLSSAEAGRNLDLNIASTAENANLNWYAHSTLARLRRYEQRWLENTHVDNLAGESSPLLIRAYQMPGFFRRATALGELNIWHSAFMDLLDRCNVLFNQPDLRRQLELEKELSSLSSKILSVVYQRLCPIIEIIS